MAAFDLSDLRARGFAGFVPVSQLDREPPEVPTASGAYVVVRSSAEHPRFLKRGLGGHWKGKDPTVTAERLAAMWVGDAATLYIGKAKSLRDRIGLLAGFSRGEPIMHWGGRVLWQIERCETLLVAWTVEPYFAALEADLIDEFIATYGKLPFANLKPGDRAALRPTPS